MGGRQKRLKTQGSACKEYSAQVRKKAVVTRLRRAIIDGKSL